MKVTNNKIALNFLEIKPSNFDVEFYWKSLSQIPPDKHIEYYKREIRDIGSDKCAIVFNKLDDFKKKVVTSTFDLDLTKRYLLEILLTNLSKHKINHIKIEKDKYRRVYFPLEDWNEGTETVWLEPYYLKQTRSFGFLLDFKFWVKDDYQEKISGSVDKRILQLSGSLDNKGFENRAFYQFKFEKYKVFFNRYLPQIQELFKVNPIVQTANSLF
jgi:glycerophosphoryl diester phosphodiesterase